MLDSTVYLVYIGIMSTVITRLELNPSDLKRYRLDRDWTLEHMARVLDLHTSTVWKIENGVTKPQERIVARILRVLPDLRRTA